MAWAHIRDLENLMRRLAREIAQRMERTANPLLSVQGLGPVITAGIVAETRLGARLTMRRRRGGRCSHRHERRGDGGPA